MKKHLLLIVAALLLGGAAVERSGTFRVMHFLRNGNQNMMAIDAGSKHGLTAGQLLTTSRQPESSPANGQTEISTGTIKIVHVEDYRAIAAAVHDGTELSRQVYGNLGGIMSGDLVGPQQFEFAKKQMILPQSVISYFDIFIDPKAYPGTFELSIEGKEKIAELAAIYADVRQPILLIEGHTDGHGPESANQIESYQRALTIRQHMIDELGFDEGRLVALGMGESEFSDEKRVPGHQRAQRRIVFKIVDSIPHEGFGSL